MKKTKKKKKELTPEEKTERSRLRRVKAIVYAVTFIVCYVLAAGIYMLIARINPFPPVRKTDSVNVRVELIAPGTAGYKNGKYNTYKTRPVVLTDGDDVLYVKFSVLEAFSGFTVTGSTTKRTYLFNDSGEYATFTDGAAFAVVNGANVSMDLPARVSGEEVSVPLSFIAEELKGIDVSFDEKRGAWYVRKTGDSVSFMHKSSDSIDNIILTAELRKYISEAPI